MYLVLYHGDGPWKAPTRVTDLFQRSDPGRYRLVSWQEAAKEDMEDDVDQPDDIVALVLGMARSIELPDMAAQFSALRRAIKERDDPDLGEFMAEMANTALRLRNTRKN